MKKRHKYGTVMVDIETNKIVDMLNSRELDKVAEWLKGFKINIFSNELIEVLPKKGGNNKENHEFEYRKKGDLVRETKKLHEQGLSIIEIAKALCITKYRVNNYINMNNEKLNKLDKPSNERLRREKRCEKTWELIQKVHEEYKTCKNYCEIGIKLNLHPNTVKKYLEITDKPQACDLEKVVRNKLSAYTDTIIELHNQGYGSKEIYGAIKEKGYSGKPTILKTFLAELKRKEKSKYKIITNITIGTLTSLLYKDVSKIKDITEEIFNKIKDQNKELTTIYYIVESFKTVLFSKESSILDLWLQDIEKLDIPQINTFIAGVRRDITAVKNAIDLKYSNGLAEGSVNKIKVIKRIIYNKKNI